MILASRNEHIINGIGISRCVYYMGMKYRNGSHTKYKNRISLCLGNEYRYRVLTGDVGLRVRELARQAYEH